MDYYNIDSELIETLNILRPPVRREQEIKKERRFTDPSIKYYVEGTPVELLKNTRKDQTEYCNLRKLKSSLSLILQRTSQRQIIEQYSLYSCQNKSEENPPITKVPAVPNAEKKPITKRIRNNRLTKTILETCSNQEHSVPSKNVYIIVAGEKKKLHQIKTSANLNKHDQDDELNDYYKQIYNNIKMERKKKKGKQKAGIKVVENGTDPGPFCGCSKDDYNDRDLSGTNRVRIVGRLGINEHDKYILRCDATVNDQPVLNYSKVEICTSKVGTNSSNINVASSSDSLPVYRAPFLIEDRVQRSDKETMTTRSVSPPLSYNRIADLENLYRIINEEHDRRISIENEMDTKIETHAPKYYKKQSQSTQADLIKTTQPTLVIEQGTQCNCKLITKRSIEKSFEDTYDSNGLESENPIVIISVFPKQVAVKTVSCTNVDTSYQITKNTEKVNENSKPVRSQSPKRLTSPAKRISKPTEEDIKQRNVREVKTVQRSPRSKSPKAKLTPRDKVTQKVEKESRQSKISNMNEKQHNNNKKQERAINTDKPKINNQPIRNKLAKTTTKQKVRNIVKSNTNDNKVIELKEPNTTNKSNVSKVSVNINSENEFYDVVFEQKRYNTDLTVRQKIKDPNTRKGAYKADSLENLRLPVIDDVSVWNGRSVSHNSKKVEAAEEKSRIQIRDSIEIGHRREVKEHANNIKDTQTRRDSERNSKIANDTNLKASLKHFTGDDCVIYDPVVRDKEIRELLGIQKRNKNQHAMMNSFNELSCQPMFNSSSCDSFITGMVHNKLCAYLCVENDTKIQDKPKITKAQEFKQSNDPVNIDFKKQTKGERVIIVNNIITSPRNNIYKNVLEIHKEVKCQDYKTPEANLKQKNIHLTRKHYNKLKTSIRKCLNKRQRGKLYKNSSVLNRKYQTEMKLHRNKEMQTDQIVEKKKELDNKIVSNTEPVIGTGNNKTIVLFSKEIDKDKTENKHKVQETGKSMKMKQTSAALVQQFMYHNIDSFGTSTSECKRHNSLETLYRGHEKSHTPNLGTSAFSLLSDVKATSKSESLIASTSKPRKPFLRRLMSCLVMRSGKAEEVAVKRESTVPYSSVNSYHFSSSLAAFDMTSSLYDTSASFYSNHTIGSLKRRAVKRGFLNSVREFLTARKT